MSLSDASIRQIRPGKVAARYYDTAGVYLEVTPAGGFLWRYKYQFAGKGQLLALGKYPSVSLKAAREAALRAKALQSSGINPAQARAEAKQAALTARSDARQANKAKRVGKRSDALTFGKLAEEWLKVKVLPAMRPATIKKARIHIGHLQELSSRPAALITEAELLRIVKRIDGDGRRETAGRVLHTASRIFQYGNAAHGSIITANPALNKVGALSTQRTRHRAAATDAEVLAGVLRKLETYTGHHSTRCALQLLPYLPLRQSELRCGLWSEVDFTAKLWTIPASRMKAIKAGVTSAGHDLVVPLAPQVIKLLRAQQKAANSELMFPTRCPVISGAGSGKKTKCISDAALGLAMKKCGIAPEIATPHGFRASFSTLLNEADWPADWIECQLAHTHTNRVRAVYNKARYLPQRTAMMTQWADYIDALRAAKPGKAGKVPAPKLK